VVGPRPLLSAATNGHMTLMRCLIEELGAHVNDVTTLLFIAAQYVHLARWRNIW
jgi:hypothetical protein